MLNDREKRRLPCRICEFDCLPLRAHFFQPEAMLGDQCNRQIAEPTMKRPAVTPADEDNMVLRVRGKLKEEVNERLGRSGLVRASDEGAQCSIIIQKQQSPAGGMVLLNERFASS